MRLTIALLFVPLIASASGEDSVFVRFRGDTTEIWNSNVTANCASRFTISVQPLGSGFLIIETDTSQRKATCTCLFDLRVDLANVVPGHYFASVKREYLTQYGYPRDTLVHVGRVEFDVISPTGLPLWANAVQGDCKPETSVPGESEAFPLLFSLSQNYPNPFNPSTTIRYALPHAAFVQLAIYNTLGQHIVTLVRGEHERGFYEATFNASRLSSGVYLYRLTAGDFVQSRRLLFLR
jgi:hypothetical protein